MTKYFKHAQAIVDSPNVGERTRVWAFSHILPGARIGSDCNICESVFIENDVVVGDRVTIKNGVQLWDGVRLEDDVFVGPNVTFTNDRFPRSRIQRAELPPIRICAGASIGANATILPGITVGANAMVGAGSVVVRDVQAGAVVVGNPASRVNERTKRGVNSSAARADIDPLARIHPAARLSDDVRVMAGAYIHAKVIISTGCRIGPNVSFIDNPDGDTRETTVHEGVHIGASAVIGSGVSIASKSVIKPGSVVIRSVPPNAIVEGSPAAIVGYVGTDIGKSEVAASGAPQATPSIAATRVTGVTVHNLPYVHDMRGDLVVGEFERHVPFAVRRFFIVHGVPSREVRGEHAHIECQQFLVCVKGDCAVIADDGHDRVEITLDSPSKGVYLPPMVWGIQYKHSPDAILLVFASHYYDSVDYIREYTDFTARVEANLQKDVK